MPKSTKKVFRNSILQTGNAFLTTGLNFLLTFIYTRMLDPSEFGALVTSQAQVLVWILLVDLGLFNGLISALTVAEGDKKERQDFRAWDIVKRVLMIRLSGATVGALFVISVSWLRYSRTGQLEQFYRDIAFVPHLFAFAVQYTFTAYAIYRERQGLTVMANLSGMVATVALTVFFTFKGAPIYILLLSQSWGGYLAASIMFFSFWKRPIVSTTRRETRSQEKTWAKRAWIALIRDAWPYALVFAVMVLWQRLDQIAASHFLGFSSGGQYALAIRLVGIPVLLIGSFYVALFPDLQRVGRDAPEKIVVYVGSITKFLFRYGLLISFGCLLGIRVFFLPFFPKFAEAKHLLFWFVPGIWAYWIYNFINGALFSLRHFKDAVIVHFCALGIYIVALLILPKANGLKGVAMAYDTFCICLFMFSFYALKRARALPKGIDFWRAYSSEEQAFLHGVVTRLISRH